MKKIKGMQQELETLQEKKRPTTEKEKAMRKELDKLYVQLEARYNMQMNNNNSQQLEMQKGLLKQWKAREMNPPIEVMQMKEIDGKKKKLVIGFGAAKFPSHGIPREEIKQFFRRKKVIVYDINEYNTSKKCCVCGEVSEPRRRKKRKSKLVHNFCLIFTDNKETGLSPLVRMHSLQRQKESRCQWE